MSVQNLLLLSIFFYLISCKPSARFRANEQEPDIHPPQETVMELNSYVRDWLNIPYEYGGMSKQGVDCSGFTLCVMRDVYHIDIPRTSEEQYVMGRKISIRNMLAGDLLFFRNVRGRGIDHVGVYLGGTRFVHASTNDGVIISDLEETYYQERFVGACRYDQ